MQQVSNELYDKLNELGMIPNEVRKGNIGKSNYSKHIIQPWSIWLDYNLNPWDADIVKRILRTKEEPGMSPNEARIMDYNKIKHICDERIRQIELEIMSDVTGSNDSKAFDVEDIDPPTKELTMKDEEILNIGNSLHGEEVSRYIKFCSRHNLCKDPVEVHISHESGIGPTVRVRCPNCGEVEDITDVGTW